MKKKLSLIILLTAMLVCVCSVPALAKALTITTGDSSVMVSKSLTLKANMKGVTWKSGNKKIATVSSKGKVTALKPGSVKITAKKGSRKASVTITVNKIELPLTYISHMATEPANAQFALAYITNDPMPELVVKKPSPYTGYMCAIYTYKNDHLVTLYSDDYSGYTLTNIIRCAVLFSTGTTMADVSVLSGTNTLRSIPPAPAVSSAR